VTWNSSDLTRASVTGTGPFGQSANVAAFTCPTGQEDCTAVISATVAGVAPNGAPLTVLKPPNSVIVAPSSQTLSLLGLGFPRQQTFNAVALAADGTQITKRGLTWCTLNPGGNCAPSNIISLNTTTGPGVIATATGLGTVTLRATIAGPSGPVSNVSTITVIP
jgi:hypothetical protein